MLKLVEHEVRKQDADLVVAALGANRKDQAFAGSCRRVFSPTDRTVLPVAADLKRVMREEARLGEKTFALTADVAEAHRQIPIHPRHWH